MGDYDTRVWLRLSFDTEKERDIINRVAYLTEHRKLGNFIEQLLRFAVDHNEELAELGFNSEDYGITKMRDKFFGAVNAELKEMMKKIDEVYDIAFSLKCMAYGGHVVGLTEQADNLISAQYVVDEQLKKLQSALGVEDLRVSNAFEHKELDDRAKEVVEYIKEHYSAELNSLVNQVGSIQSQVGLLAAMFGMYAVNMDKPPLVVNMGAAGGNAAGVGVAGLAGGIGGNAGVYMGDTGGNVANNEVDEAANAEFEMAAKLNRENTETNELAVAENSGTNVDGLSTVDDIMFDADMDALEDFFS